MNKFIEIPCSKLSLSKRKLVFGMGINDASYTVSPKINGKQVSCPYYVVWRSMLGRCYNVDYQTRNKTYLGCTVCTSWLTFSNFRRWMEKQDWQGKELDKDLLVKGNKVYSPETCVFLNIALNRLLNPLTACITPHGLGVSFDKSRKQFQATISRHNKTTTLGRFQTENEASLCYRKAKYAHILELSELPENAYIKPVLIARANLLLE